MAKKMKQYKTDIVDDIIEILEDKSKSIIDYINENKDSRFILYYKYLYHSDLLTSGKLTKKDGNLEDNLLYYLNYKQMQEIEIKENKKFETAHQSNIHITNSFWYDLGMDDDRNSVGKNREEKLINNFADVFLVNDTFEFFNYKFTLKIFNKLNKNFKNFKWNQDTMDFIIDKDSNFTKIELSQAVHGIGVAEDYEFHKLRHNFFKNDSLFFLIEIKENNEKKLFILANKNPIFFNILGEKNDKWVNYQNRYNKQLEYVAKDKTLIEEESIKRQYQNKWRILLAEEMMNYTTSEDEVFCPFTWIEANFEDVGTLYRASHIKPYSCSNDNEKYDINNGLLLIANADALFDKFLISVNQKKELEFSFLLKNNHKLISKLALNNEIFKEILNERRMDYLKFHYDKFREKEKERKAIP